jgi:hypothetical protein
MGRYYLRLVRRVYLLAEIIVEAENQAAAKQIGETVAAERVNELEWETIDTTDNESHVDSVSECDDPPQWRAVNGNVVKWSQAPDDGPEGGGTDSRIT